VRLIRLFQLQIFHTLPLPTLCSGIHADGQWFIRFSSYKLSALDPCLRYAPAFVQLAIKSKTPDSITLRRGTWWQWPLSTFGSQTKKTTFPGNLGVPFRNNMEKIGLNFISTLSAFYQHRFYRS